MPKKILSVAMHPAVSETRQLLLQSAGFYVTSVSSLPDLLNACSRDKYDLLVITQGISAAEKRRIFSSFRQSCDGVPVLEIFEVSPELSGAEFRFQAHEGPQALVKTIQSILQPENA